MTSILSQYLYVRLDTDWLGFAETTSRQIDVSRFGAQVYSGIGFLAAGTIIVTGRQEVKGLTTAAGGHLPVWGLPSVRDFMSVLSLHLC